MILSRDHRGKPRLVNPERGIVLLIGGPDRSGKTTLRNRLMDELDIPTRVIHYRPAVWRTKTSVPEDPVATPHAQKPYSRVLSWCKLAYLWVDFLLGWVGVVRPMTRKGGIVIWERGWWDMIVDPRRYRLKPTRLAVVLGHLQPAPDLVVLFSTCQVKSEQQELSVAEFDRQVDAWRFVLKDWSARLVEIDERLDPQSIARTVLDRIRAERRKRESSHDN